MVLVAGEAFVQSVHAGPATDLLPLSTALLHDCSHTLDIPLHRPGTLLSLITCCVLARIRIWVWVSVSVGDILHMRAIHMLYAAQLLTCCLCQLLSYMTAAIL